MTLKRLIVSLCIVLIFCITFIGGYTRSSCIVYADSTTDDWTQVTTNEQLSEAFIYYCKSRDLTIEGSIADGVTTFTTKAFIGACNTLGIDVTALQAQIKYQTDGNLGTRFLFSSVGINAFNRIFAQFLQDNNLSVGDEVNDLIVADGPMYRGQFVYVFDSTDTNSDQTAVKYGSDILGYRGVDFLNLYNSGVRSLDYPIFGTIKTYELYYTKSTYETVYISWTTWPKLGVYDSEPPYNYNGAVAYCYFPRSYSNRIYCCNVMKKANGKYRPYQAFGYEDIKSEGNYNSNVTVSITTNNNVINNNTYEGDTIINNDGTPSSPSSPDPEPDYDPYPDGGGGTTPPTNTGGGSGEDDGTITFPDFDFHLPEINWSLGDLSEKFPFSIPFDLIAFFTVLNAEPRAPAIDADIPFGSWYTWHFEADFSQFDNYAVIIRNVEFIGFCVGLIYLTIKLVKG